MRGQHVEPVPQNLLGQGATTDVDIDIHTDPAIGARRRHRCTAGNNMSGPILSGQRRPEVLSTFKKSISLRPERGERRREAAANLSQP